MEIFKLIKNRDLEGINDLLKTDAATLKLQDENGLSPLMLSLYYQDQAITEKILEYLEEFNIYEAAALGYKEQISAFLNNYPEQVNEFSSDGFTLLGLAAFFGKIDVVKILINAGADVNLRSHNAMNVAPLHSAVARGSFEILEQLLVAGAVPDIEQNNGITALHAAALHGNMEMAKLLISYGADPFHASSDGKSSLDYAREGEHEDMIRFLESF